MLQFIVICHIITLLNKSFNTSHVVVYLTTIINVEYQTMVSIHLMLQFIDLKERSGSLCIKFQYISCCSLSKREKRLFTLLLSFNTSHVVVYHRTYRIPCYPTQFQYISCCSLSKKRMEVQLRLYSVSIHLMLQFIPVPVYLHPFCQNRFNTSHVVVYRCLKSPALHSRRSFNTSHVVVYPFPPAHKCVFSLFQYISCCSLSGIGLLPGSGSAVSIHLMLQFIQRLLFSSVRSINVSIHLMLQFINKNAGIPGYVLVFQYISCCSLSCTYSNFSSIYLKVSIHLMLQFILSFTHALCGGRRVSIHLMLQFIGLL